MSINDIGKKIKPYWTERAIPFFFKIKESLDIKEDIFIVVTIVLVGLAGFGLGKLSALEKDRESVQIKPANFTSDITTGDNSKIPMSAAALVSSVDAKGFLVASKSGTKYHFPWCAGASQIAEKDKIWFNSYEEARKAGYTPASNCKGLE